MSRGTGGRSRTGSDGSRYRDSALPPADEDRNGGASLGGPCGEYPVPRDGPGHVANPGRVSPPFTAPLGPDHFLAAATGPTGGEGECGGGTKTPEDRGRRRRLTDRPEERRDKLDPRRGKEARGKRGAAHWREETAAPQGSRRSIAGRGRAGGEARRGEVGERPAP